MSGDIFETLPTWIIFVLTGLMIMASSEVGYRIGCRRIREEAKEENSATAIATGSLLGLVSFLLAFTFGIAASHYEARRQIVLQEANAIGTAYLRTDLLPAPQDQQVAALLKEYAEVRLDAVNRGISSDNYHAVVARSEEIQTMIWRIVMDLAKTNRTALDALVVASINDVIDLHAERIMQGVRSTIPLTIWISLYLVSAIGIASTGYRIGTNSQKRSELLPGLVIAFSVVITLIADLDNPRHGFLKNDQAAIEDLVRTMQHGQ